MLEMDGTDSCTSVCDKQLLLCTLAKVNLSQQFLHFKIEINFVLDPYWLKEKIFESKELLKFFCSAGIFWMPLWWLIFRCYFRRGGNLVIIF